MLSLILLGACTTQTVKKEIPQKEKVNSATFLSRIENKEDAPFFMFPVDQYLWTFYNDRIVIHSKLGKITHFYKDDKVFPCKQYVPKKCTGACGNNIVGTTDCIPSLKIYGKSYRNDITRLSEPRGLDVNEEKVVIHFSGRDKIYKKNGTYLDKKMIKRTKKSNRELHQGQKLLGFKNDPEQGNVVPIFRGNSGHELFRIGNFFFSGDWLLMYEPLKVFKHDPTDFRYGNPKIHFVYQPGGYIVKTIQNATDKYRVREYGEGFYLDKLVGEDIRPYMWFGKYIVDLEEPSRFCYAYKDFKKCVQNTGPPIRQIFENSHFRATIAGRGKEKKLYLEWR